MKTVVVDANVVAKTFAREADAPQAISFLRVCVAEKVNIIAPDLFRYEIAQIAIRKKHALENVADLLEEHISVLVDLQPPKRSVWLQAEKICLDGHVKSGFPSLYDSIYHAMAIVEGGVFVTADRRHYEKSKKYGHIVMLQSWERLFSSDA